MNPARTRGGGSWRAWWRRASLGLPTVLGMRPGGYFIPYRYAASTLHLGNGTAGYPIVADLLGEAAPDMCALLRNLDAYRPALAAIGDQAPPEPRWQQDWFPRLDAAVAYGLLRERRPKRVIEIGSGHSTRFLWRAVRDGGLETRITAIDPAPRADLDGLPIDLRRSPLQGVDSALFDELAAGDFLLIDSSHILMPGSDLDRLLGEILPKLVPGVMVQFHDIFLPDPYPKNWDWRGYNEQQALIPLLTGGGWRPLFASHYVTTRHPEWLAEGLIAGLPLPEGALESALWMRKEP